MRRTLAWILPLLLVAATLAGAPAQAQPPCEGAECRPCADQPPRERRACEERCDADPDHPSCTRPRDGGGPGPRPTPGPTQPGPGPSSPSDCDDCGTSLRWISFNHTEDPFGFSEYRVDGKLVLRALELAVPMDLERRGNVLRATGPDARLEVHDTPNGLLSFRSSNATMGLLFPSDARVEAGDGVARIQYADGQRALLRFDEHTLSDSGQGTRVLVSGFASLHFFGHQAAPRGAEEVPSPVARERLERAIERGALGAELVVRGPQGQQERASVLSYADVDIQTQVPDVATPADPLRVVLSSDLPTGRAFSLTIDPELVPGVDPLDVASTLEVRYFDVEEGVEREAGIVMATDLDDVLDVAPGEAAEYWVVVDPNGVQVLFMVPHWSTHVLTLASLEPIAELVTDPPVLIGILAGVAGAFVAAVAVLWPRRRE